MGVLITVGVISIFSLVFGIIMTIHTNIHTRDDSDTIFKG